MAQVKDYFIMNVCNAPYGACLLPRFERNKEQKKAP
jgi:hypothetical protein